jgi:hypothetical protein
MAQTRSVTTEKGRLRIDPYRLFLAVVIGGLSLVSIAMLVVALWLFRRNRRLPRLVKRRHRR